MTATAIPKEGYAFAGWKIEGAEIVGTRILKQYPSNSLTTGIAALRQYSKNIKILYKNL